MGPAGYGHNEPRTAEINVSQIRRLAEYMLPYKKQIFSTVVVMFLATLSQLLGPYLLQQSIDVHIPKRDISGLVLVSVLYLVAIGSGYFFDRMRIFLANRVGQLALLDLRRKLFNHVQDLSFDYFNTHSTGRVIVRIVNDVEQLNNLFTNGIVNVLTEFTMLGVAAAIMLFIHPQLALVTFVVVPPFMVIMFFSRNYIRDKWRTVRQKNSNLNGYLHENIVGMKVIQAYVRQKHNDRTFHQIIKDVCDSWMDAIRLNNAFGPAVELMSLVATLIIYWYGARLLQMDGITVGVIIAFTVYLQRFWHPVIVLSQFYNQLLVAMASSERIFDLMDQEVTISDHPQAVPLRNVAGQVKFEDVTFSYDGQRDVLRDLNFTVEPGETLAIVGATGSGKTTIIALLARFFDPQQGRILIDGQDVKESTLDSLRDNIGVMLQDPFIFSGTVLDNIRFARPDATRAEVVEVAKAVRAHSFIENMEDGYDTWVNERGSRLSVGQRQLIAFARVLLSDPRILILDEATASVDTHTEILLQKAVDKLLEGRTSFVIAHRLSTIRNADRIMVIDGGRIVELGTHSELMDKQGIYYELYNVQYESLQAV